MTKSASNDNTTSLLDQLTLGKSVNYQDNYAPELLQPVPRAMNRVPLGMSDENLPFSGIDLWTGYELSWLNLKGKPQIAILVCEIPVRSPNLVESKSFKLYLNSFNQSKFASMEQVRLRLVEDLSQCAGSPVNVTLYSPSQFNQFKIENLSGTCIDDLDIETDRYSPDINLLSVTEQMAEESLVSHLLKSNCLITQQPDWASVQIRYTGNKICHEGLLKYLISFRQHNEFHEQCIERIFCDLLVKCKPVKLTVYARYTRRGGLDINPFRSNFEQLSMYNRQARQ